MRYMCIYKIYIRKDKIYIYIYMYKIYIRKDNIYI